MSSRLAASMRRRSFDYKSERGEACAVGSLSMMQNILIRLKKIRFFKVGAGDFVD